jgi:hypothetical protein
MIAVIIIGGNETCKAVSISVRTSPLMYSTMLFHNHLPTLVSMEQATRKKSELMMAIVVSRLGVADQSLLC